MAIGCVVTPPRDTVVHQHRFRQAVVDKCLLQMLPYGISVGRHHRLQGNGIAAVVVDARQRTNRTRPVPRSVEIHLPELVGPFPLTAPCRLLVAILVTHQLITQQWPMDSSGSKLHPLTSQQNLQLARAPVGVALAKGYHPFFLPPGCLSADLQRPAATLPNPRNTGTAVALQPQITSRATDAELAAEGGHVLFPTQRRHRKL